MSDDIKLNRVNPSAPRMESNGPVAMEQMPAKSSKLPWIILAVIVVVLVVVGVLFRDKLFKGKANNAATTVKSSGYQAVFLTNGQVYFGKISTSETDFVTLKDIYYLQVVQPPLQGQQQPDQQAQQNQSPQISLVKLGQELHGPVDEMHISRAQILFYEDLKNDGKVVEAIKSYQATPAK